MNIFAYTLSALLGFVASTTFAQSLGRDAADFVGAPLAGPAGGDFSSIASNVALSFVPFANVAAVLVIVIAGILAVIAQDENKIASARKVIVMAVVGIVLINIASRIATGFMTAFNYDRGANIEAGTSIIITELFGFMAFAETPLIIVAIITIIVYGMKAVLDYNGDQGIQAFKKAIFSVLLGILIITVKFVLADSVVTGNPSGIISPAVSTLFTVVGFVALVGVVVIAFGGVYLIVNIADENRATKAKQIIISVTAGIAFMLVIAGLLSILIQGVFDDPNALG